MPCKKKKNNRQTVRCSIPAITLIPNTLIAPDNVSSLSGDLTGGDRSCYGRNSEKFATSSVRADRRIFARHAKTNCNDPAAILSLNKISRSWYKISTI